jgi:ATP-binding protein involved in chromosome partitioning
VARLANLPIAAAMSPFDQTLQTALADLPGLEGRIASARLESGIASIILDVGGLTTGARNVLEAAVRNRLAQLEQVEDVRIAMTADKVRRRLIAVGSGKGGVGKSTLSANIAVALARTGWKVGLVDADIYGPSQPRIMGNSEKPEANNRQIIPVEAHGIRMLSIGQLVGPDSALAWRGPMASNALAQLIEGDWSDSEILVIDLPPGTGDVQLSLLQKWKPDGAVIVSTPQDLALIDAARAIDLFRKMDVRILGLVENMAGFACPHCGEVSDPFGSGGAERDAAGRGIAFLGRIPLDPAIRKASDEGSPPAAGTGEQAEIFATIAARVIEQLETDDATDVG